jgi:hypothetical protein
VVEAARRLAAATERCWVAILAPERRRAESEYTAAEKGVLDAVQALRDTGAPEPAPEEPDLTPGSRWDTDGKSVRSDNSSRISITEDGSALISTYNGSAVRYLVTADVRAVIAKHDRKAGK